MDIFCLVDETGKPLPPSLQATVLAKYSRSPLSARDILVSLTIEEADKFQDKWVSGVGHNSVAEHAVVAVCAEGVSIIASKILERMPRAAYAEKSSRYQEFSQNSFVLPPGAPASMRDVVEDLYGTYSALQTPMRRRCATLMGLDCTNPKMLRKKAVRTRAFDNIRYLLPAGTGTNVGMTINMRDARDLVKMMVSSRNAEIREIGERIRDVTTHQCPTLMRHAEPNDFLLSDGSLGKLSDRFDPTDPRPYVDLYRPELLADPRLVQRSFEDLITHKNQMSWDDFCRHMDDRPPHAEVPQEFARVTLEFDVMMDYGAFRDLQRHRRCVQWTEPLSTSYGYVIPDDIKGSEMERDYRRAMDRIALYDGEAMNDVHLAQYVIPLGYLSRSMFRVDLRQLYYMVELRTQGQGHISYRRIAYEMYEIAKRVYPELMRWCRAVKPTEVGVHS